MRTALPLTAAVVPTSSPEAQAYYEQGIAYLRSYVPIKAARSSHIGLRIAALLLACVAPRPAHAQPEPLVLPRITGPIQLDGKSDEAAWLAVAPLPVIMHAPTFGEEPSERTVFRLAYDHEYLYASGQLFDSEPGGIRATSLKRDDTSFSNDWFVLMLDSFNDKENALLFGTNPAGIRTDGVFPNDAQGPPSFDWGTFWDAAVQQTEEGWFAEIRIPLSSLRFQERDGRVVMGVSVWRRIARKNEMITFPAIPNQWGVGSVFKASQTREVSLQDIRRRSPLYATPYLLGGMGRSHTLNADSTAYTRSGQSVRELGLDTKYALTSNLTLDLTYNPDFAQVEADDQQVNLTRFSLFFPEKRLFFQERAAVFDFSTGESNRLFYSRRIGLTGGRQVPIHGGMRLVGRVEGWDVGVLNMQAAEFEHLPSQNFGAARLRRQVLNENSYVGGILTSRLGGEDRNLTYGLDGILRLYGQDYLTLNWAQSYGEQERRADGVLDRSLARARWERRGIDGLTYILDASRVGEMFDPALGFLLRSDYTRIGDQIAYGWRPGKESALLRHMLALKGYAYRRNRDGSVESARLGPEWVVETKSGHQVTLGGAGIQEEPESDFQLSDRATVPRGRYRFFAASLGYQAPLGATLRPNFTLESGSFFDGWQVTARIVPIWNFSRHLELGGSFQISEIGLPERDQGFHALVAGLRALMMLSTHFSAAAFVQYNSAVDGLFGNLRIRYNPREGNDLYLVYNTGLNVDRFEYSPIRPVFDNHVLMIKYAHTLDLGL